MSVFGAINRYPEERVSGQWVQDPVIAQNVIPNGAIIETTDFTTFADPVTGRIFVPSGTLLGRSAVERDAGIGFGLADPATDDEIYLTLYDIYDLTKYPLADFYRHGRLVFYNFLPDLMDGTPLLGSPQYTKIRELYECWIGNL